MMTAAALFSTAGFPCLAADPADMWPGAGTWRVALMQGTASPVCTALALPQHVRNFDFIASFAFSKTTTHFYVQFSGTGWPAPRKIDLLADETLVFSGPTEQVPPEPPAAAIFRIDLPGDTLAHTILPALTRATNLRIRLDAATLTVPVPDFSRVVEDLKSCIDAGNHLGQRP
jgi:hypothetical protein